MKQSVAVLAIFAVLVALAVAPGMVAGQEEAGADGEEPTDSSDRGDDAEESETDDEESDSVEEGEVAEQAASELWTLMQEDADKTQAEQNEIIQTVDSTTWVTGVEWDQDAEVARITITTRRTTSLTFTDSSGIDPEQSSGVTAQSTETIPRGTYTIVVPATVADDGNQMVTLPGAEGLIWLSNQETTELEFLDYLMTTKIALGGIAMFLLGILARVGWMVYRKQETGQPVSLDGTPVETDRVGVEDDD